MRCITAPADLPARPRRWPVVFLAGGITGCPDWQQLLSGLLAPMDGVLLNPRRAQFPIGDPAEAEAQIGWEYRHLRYADAIVFWLPCETLCPIVLYELGAWSLGGTKPIFVGVHPDYARRQDVALQTALVRPEVRIVHSLPALADQVKDWAAAPRL